MASEVDAQTLHYLKSILGHLRELQAFAEGATLGGEALADNINWLDCYIDELTRKTGDPRDADLPHR